MDQLFSGYVELSGKQCVQKLKDGVYLTKDDAIRLDSYGGVLAPSTILIDIDDDTQSQRFYSMVTGEGIECVVVKTTRGRHFYFSGFPAETRCRTHTRLACGIDADIKVGTRTCYGVLKISGTTRVIERDSLQCDPLPAWACPVSWSPDFEHMAEVTDATRFFLITSSHSKATDSAEMSAVKSSLWSTITSLTSQ